MLYKEILYFCLLLFIFLSPSAQSSSVDDIRIVIDVSGSMVKTDPNNLRGPALRMLNGLVATGSKAGVWMFGRYVNMEVKWGRVDEAWRKRADAGAQRIHSRGQFTNIESALNRTTAGWKKPDKKTRRSIILLTDGKVDISRDAHKNATSRINILTKTIPELVKNGVQVHAIALSNEADEELLKRIALDTSGSFEIAQSAGELQRIFLRMFERAAKPDTVPLKGNKFNIDKSIREMTLLVFRKGDEPVQLFQPDGSKHAMTDHGKQVRWRNDLGYDLITVSKPQPGEWILDAEVDDGNRVMIVTDLKLLADDLPAYSTPDKDLWLEVELQDKGKKITRKSFLKFVDFEVNHRYRQTLNSFPLELKKSRNTKDKGIYLERIRAPLGEGRHEIIVSADARTFKREKRFLVEVQWPVMVSIDRAEAMAEHQLSIRARPEYMLAKSLKPEVNLYFPDGQTKPVVTQLANDSWQAHIKVNEQNGLHRLRIKIQGKSIQGEEIAHQLSDIPLIGVKLDTSEKVNETTKPEQTIQAEVTAADEVADDDSGFMNSIVLIVVVNGVLVIVAAGVFFYLRKKKSKDKFSLLNEVNEELGSD